MHAHSMDMWNAFLGRGVTFLQGNTLHRLWWYPNGPPGQLQNPWASAARGTTFSTFDTSLKLPPTEVLPHTDSYSLTAPGSDFGMIGADGKRITLEMCIDDIKHFNEYLEMRGDIPTISWKPSDKTVNNRFNVPGRFWSGYKLNSGCRIH